LARKRVGNKTTDPEPLRRLSDFQHTDPERYGLSDLSDEELGRAAYGCVVCVEAILKESKESRGIDADDLNDVRVMLHRLVEIIAFMRQGGADITVCSGK